MNLSRLWTLAKKDIKLTTREKFFLFMILMPILATMVINVALGNVSVSSNPSLAYYGDDGLAAILSERPNIEFTVLETADAVIEGVENGEYDGGLLYDGGPVLYVSGSSLLSDRLSLASTTSSAISEMEGVGSLVNIESEVVGDEEFSLRVRLIPSIILFSILVAGFIISASLVEEREKKTINALLISPVSTTEIILSKTLFGLFVGVVLGSLILLLYNIFSGILILPFLLLGTVFTVGIGLITGSVMDNITDLIARQKIFNSVLIFPALVVLFPQIPQWIAKFFPTYYFIDPILRISQSGAGMGDVWMEMLVLVACDLVVLMLAIKVLKRRMIGKNMVV
ncbi:MAG TPA: ABC transporter permease [Candidatus Methanofastidiosa archaeon]|nr:ABC transporter permease [Candidatus Methanofastidiosa archaeon]HPR41632.1 ABC transporter permease [Candidatus Methanofastidiosa archaeon]